MKNSGLVAGPVAMKEAHEIVERAQWPLPGTDVSIAYHALLLNIFVDLSSFEKDRQISSSQWSST